MPGREYWPDLGHKAALDITQVRLILAVSCNQGKVAPTLWEGLAGLEGLQCLRRQELLGVLLCMTLDMHMLPDIDSTKPGLLPSTA